MIWSNIETKRNGMRTVMPGPDGLDAYEQEEARRVGSRASSRGKQVATICFASSIERDVWLEKQNGPQTYSEKSTVPDLPGVYRVIYEDHCGRSTEVNGLPMVAYWDGVDTWSQAWCFSVKEAYAARSKPGIRYAWAGEAL